MNSASLLTRFLGCYAITIYGSVFYYAVQQNIFREASHGVHERCPLPPSPSPSPRIASRARTALPGLPDPAAPSTDVKAALHTVRTVSDHRGLRAWSQ